MSDRNIRSVGNREIVWLLVTMVVSKILFADIGGYVQRSGTAAYVQTFFCCLLYLATFAATVFLSGEDTDVIKACKDGLGKKAATSLGLIFSVLLLLLAGVMFRVYADVISSIALPESPSIFILLILIVAAAFAAFAGVGTVTAYSYVAGIVLAIALAAILALNIPNYDLTNIYPLMGTGADKIFTGFEGMNVYADVVLIFLITPYLKSGTSVSRSGIKSILISGALITATTFCYVLTVEYPFSGELTLPVLEIAFDVNLDVIFQRAEGLFFFVWIFSGFIVTGVYICFSLLCFVRSFELSDRRAPIGAFLFLAVCIALFAENAAQSSKAYGWFYNTFTALAVALPVTVFGIRRLKRR